MPVALHLAVQLFVRDDPVIVLVEVRDQGRQVFLREFNAKGLEGQEQLVVAEGAVAVAVKSAEARDDLVLLGNDGTRQLLCELLPRLRCREPVLALSWLEIAPRARVPHVLVAPRPARPARQTGTGGGVSSPASKRHLPTLGPYRLVLGATLSSASVD